MPESVQDLLGVLLGLVALWFLFGALINQERLWRDREVAQRRRARLAGPRGDRSSSR
jgi:hypothetical protein